MARGHSSIALTLAMAFAGCNQSDCPAASNKESVVAPDRSYVDGVIDGRWVVAEVLEWRSVGVRRIELGSELVFAEGRLIEIHGFGLGPPILDPAHRNQWANGQGIFESFLNYCDSGYYAYDGFAGGTVASGSLILNHLSETWMRLSMAGYTFHTNDATVRCERPSAPTAAPRLR